jgi:hypothetical protein
MEEKGIKLSEWFKDNLDHEALVIARNLPAPPEAPYLLDKAELFDPVVETEPEEAVSLAYGGRPNVNVRDVVRAIRRDIGSRGYALHISDKSYTGYSIWDVHRYVTRHDRTDLLRYMREIFDCDDFAQVLQGNVNRVMMGIPFGTIWYYGQNWGHAVNIGYCHIQKKIYLVEPQNDRFYRFKKGTWRPGMIII